MRLAAIAVIAALVGTAALADAQPHGPRVEKHDDKRDELKKKIRVMRAYELTEELALDEATTGKLFPILAKYDELTDAALAQRGQLRKQLDDPPADPKATDKLVDESIANQHALWKLQDDRLGELRKVLTPAQTAKLLVVLPALEHRIDSQLREAAAGKGGGKGAGKKPRDRNGNGNGDGAGGRDDASHDLRDPF